MKENNDPKLKSTPPSSPKKASEQNIDNSEGKSKEEPKQEPLDDIIEEAMSEQTKKAKKSSRSSKHKVEVYDLSKIKTTRSKVLNRDIYIVQGPDSIPPSEEITLPFFKDFYYELIKGKYVMQLKKRFKMEPILIKRFNKSTLQSYDLTEMIKQELVVTETLSRSEFILNLEGIFEKNGMFNFVFEPMSTVFKYSYIIPTISENFKPPLDPVQPSQKSEINPNRGKDLSMEKDTIIMLVHALIGLVEINELGYTIPDFSIDNICTTREGLIKVFNLCNLTKHGQNPIHSYPSKTSPPEIKQNFKIFHETLSWTFMQFIILLIYQKALDFKHLKDVDNFLNEVGLDETTTKNLPVKSELAKLIKMVFKPHPPDRIKPEQILKFSLFYEFIKNDHHLMTIVPPYILEKIDLEPEQDDQNLSALPSNHEEEKFQEEMDTPKKVFKATEGVNYSFLDRRRMYGMDARIKGFGRDRDRDKKVQTETMGMLDTVLNFFGCFSNE